MWSGQQQTTLGRLRDAYNGMNCEEYTEEKEWNVPQLNIQVSNKSEKEEENSERAERSTSSEGSCCRVLMLTGQYPKENIDEMEARSSLSQYKKRSSIN